MKGAPAYLVLESASFSFASFSFTRGAIHDQGTTFGRLTENGLFWITSHAWYA